MSHNAGLAFYRYYYDPEKWDFVEQCPIETPESIRRNKDKLADEQKKFFRKQSKVLFDQSIPKKASADDAYYGYETVAGIDRELKLYTTYPGLLLGSGYAHGIGDAKGEHKIGFYFDHTSGRPIIPGSSLKGVLRSVFPGRYGEDSEERTMRYAYIQDVLTDPQYTIGFNPDAVDNGWIDDLEAQLFDGKIAAASEQYIPIPHRTIFHDAIITGPPETKLLGNDFLTPHNQSKGNIPAELRDPIPLQFLKVMPGVEITFQFRLPAGYRYRNERGELTEEQPYLLTKEQCRKLFQSILLDIGIGAKSYVGYGQLATSPPKREKVREASKTIKTYGTAEVGTVIAEYPPKDDPDQEELDAVVIGPKGIKEMMVQVYWKESLPEQKFRIKYPAQDLPAGAVIRVSVGYAGGKKKKPRRINQVSFKDYKK